MRNHLTSALIAIAAAIIGAATTVYMQQAPDASEGVTAVVEVIDLPVGVTRIDAEALQQLGPSLEKAGVSRALINVAKAAEHRSLNFYRLRISNDLHVKSSSLEIEIADSLFLSLYRVGEATSIIDQSKSDVRKSLTVEPVNPEETVTLYALSAGYGPLLSRPDVRVLHGNTKVPITYLNRKTIEVFGLVSWLQKHGAAAEFAVVVAFFLAALFVFVVIYQLVLLSNMPLLVKALSPKEITRVIAVIKYLIDSDSEKLSKRHLDELSEISKKLSSSP
ncbi:MAG: hypothetical protein K2P94_17215 [Rhodospirillaceae bacterium]|nr:hypothetical protein [Rhodospirillaceae bacterium]